VLNYYVWSYVTYFVGKQLFNAAVDPGELLRVLGYASGPRVLGVLRFIPCLGWLIAFAGDIWALIAGFIGAKEALDLDATKTLITVAIGWVIIVIISFIIGAVFGVGAAGLGVVSSLLGGS